MFVKIVANSKETMYECIKTENETSETDEDVLFLKIHKADGTVETVPVNKRDTDVYFMNADGKTVDRITCR